MFFSPYNTCDRMLRHISLGIAMFFLHTHPSFSVVVVLCLDPRHLEFCLRQISCRSRFVFFFIILRVEKGKMKNMF